MTPTVGYCVPEFPSQTHAFFWREAMAMEQAGLPVAFMSTRRPPDEACPHDFAAEARARTRYVFPPRAGAAAAFLAARPLRSAAALRYIASLAETPPPQRIRLAALLPCAADLALRCREAGVDHLHIHSFANAAHLGALANILDDLPYSLTLHGDLPVYGRDHAAKMRRAAFITAVTEPLRDQIAAIAPDRDARVIPMGVDVDRFLPSSAPRHDRAMRIVSIARLNYVKGHVHVLEAMARLRAEGAALCYDIAGSGPYEAEIRARIEALGLGDVAVLHGSLSEQAVLALLRDADVFALASFGQGEAAPVAVMEAMACGVPVICSRIGGTGAMIVDGEDGFLTPQQDVDAIAAALRRLAEDPALRARIGGAAREAAVRRFDYRMKAAELADAIRGVSTAPASRG